MGVLWTLASVILVRKPRNAESLNSCTVEFSFLDPRHPHKMSQSKKWIYPLIIILFWRIYSRISWDGGGTIYTSTMLLLEITPIIAVATAEFAMIFTNTFGFLTSAVFPSLGWNFLGNGSIAPPILWEFIIPMGIASLIGAFFGTILSRRVKGTILKKMLAIIAILMGIPLVLDIFGLWGF